MNKSLPVVSTVLLLIAIIACLFTFHRPHHAEKLKKEIFQTEKAFEQMASEKSIPEAFCTFADDNATIKRGNDSLIHGREGIRIYYSNPKFQQARVNWTPDYVGVSEDGTLGYTYGKFIWKVAGENGDTLTATGVFHTVWKKQKDGSWKYVWD